MFSIKQIERAHEKVNSGADFPRYIQELKLLGVTRYETWVKDSHTTYCGYTDFSIQSPPQYPDLDILISVDPKTFEDYLHKHQQGQTDYYTFCTHCALTGIEKWIVDLNEMTCAYFDVKGQIVLVEQIPS